jgi:hypothetical protein
MKFCYVTAKYLSEAEDKSKNEQYGSKDDRDRRRSRCTYKPGEFITDRSLRCE